MILLRQAQWFFTIFRSTLSLANALELARLVFIVHIIILANLEKLSWPHRQRQGIPFDFRSISAHPSSISQSSLTLALLRCILTEGTIYYDGIPINQINLDALRSNITIIPQSVSEQSDELSP